MNTMMATAATLLRQLGANGIGLCRWCGQVGLFTLRALITSPTVVLRPLRLSRQVYILGVLSVVIIAVCAFFVGMVLGLQGYNTLVRFGAEDSVGVLIALSLTRELGPVLSALLYTGRAGSALAAEIGLMKTTDQLAAMEMMGVDPMRYVVAPRLVAGVISLPVLCVLFSAIAIYGGRFVCVGLLGVDDGAFWSQMQSQVDFRDDIVNGIIKSAVFAAAINTLAAFEGYHTIPTSSGLSRATTRTMVNASLVILGLDYLLTAVMYT